MHTLVCKANMMNDPGISIGSREVWGRRLAVPSGSSFLGSGMGLAQSLSPVS